MLLDIQAAKQKLRHELWEYLLVFLYLYVCIGTLVLYKMVSLQTYGINEYASFGFALIKALILGKFILLGHMLSLSKWLDSKPLIYSTLYKSFFFLIVLLILTSIEEVLKGLLHGETLFETISDLGGKSLPDLLINSLVVFVVLIPYVALYQLRNALGGNRLYDLFFKSRVNNEILHI